jgi:hypothetical protein
LLFGLSLSEFSEQNGITLGATRTRLKKLFTCHSHFLSTTNDPGHARQFGIKVRPLPPVRA